MMQAFDALPPAVRAALRDMGGMTAVNAQDLLESGVDEQDVVEAIKEASTEGSTAEAQ